MQEEMKKLEAEIMRTSKMIDECIERKDAIIAKLVIENKSLKQIIRERDTKSEAEYLDMLLDCGLIGSDEYSTKRVALMGKG